MNSYMVKRSDGDVEVTSDQPLSKNDQIMAASFLKKIGKGEKKIGLEGSAVLLIKAMSAGLEKAQRDGDEPQKAIADILRALRDGGQFK